MVSLAWDAAGRTLAIGCADRSAAVLTLGDGAPVDRIGGFPEAPQSLALASGPAALVASGTNRVAAWSLRGDRPEPVNRVAPPSAIIATTMTKSRISQARIAPRAPLWPASIMPPEGGVARGVVSVTS